MKTIILITTALFMAGCSSEPESHGSSSLPKDFFESKSDTKPSADMSWEEKMEHEKTETIDWSESPYNAPECETLGWKNWYAMKKEPPFSKLELRCKELRDLWGGDPSREKSEFPKPEPIEF